MKKQMKNDTGITLVALVITIIILLILAGIGITALTQPGLFEKAKESKEITENAIENENFTLGKYENTINQLTNSRSSNLNIEVKSIINSNDTLYNNGYIFETPTGSTTYDVSKSIINLNDSIEEYKYLLFDIDNFYITSNSYVLEHTELIEVNKIKELYTNNYGWKYGNYFIFVNDAGDNHNRIALSFNNSKKIVVWSGWSSSSEMTKLRIRDIKGIKY